MSETKVENVKDFLDKLAEIQKSKPDDTELFFRGHADHAYEAEPTIFRKNGNGERNLLKNEKHLFNDIITQCPEDFKDCQYTFEYLVKMQHYGLPTRLLDITGNALVALYFACCSLNDFMRDGKGNIVCDKAGKEIDQHKEGQVLVYAVRKDAIKNYNSDTVSILSNLAQIDSDFKLLDDMSIRHFHNNENKLLRAKEHIKAFDVFQQAIDKNSDDSNTLQIMTSGQKKIKSLLYEEVIIPMHFEKQQKQLESQEEDKLQNKISIKIEESILKPHFDYQESLKNTLFTKERFLHFIKQEKSYFVDKINNQDDLRKVVCVRAKLNNQRIIRQNGLFFLFGMGYTKGDAVKFSDYIKLECTKSIQEKREPTITEITNPTIIISAEKKDDILKELRTLGISKETLMPEIDTVASTLKDRYN